MREKVGENCLNYYSEFYDLLSSASAKRQSHNSIERKRKDKLKLAIDDIRKLLPETDFISSKKQVCVVFHKYVLGVFKLSVKCLNYSHLYKYSCEAGKKTIRAKAKMMHFCLLVYAKVGDSCDC